MVTVVAVHFGNYENRGAEYVAKLFDGVRRYMPSHIPLRCVCLTDGVVPLPPGVQARALPTGLSGWWNKLFMFSPEAFEPGERLVFFDLDTIILGDLTDIAAYRGNFAILTDPYHPEHVGSAVMAWQAGQLDHIWTRWDEAGRPSFHRGGDQTFIEFMQPENDRWQTLLPGQFVSYKADCWKQGKIPEGARVLCFHGHPRPHECVARFIKEIWNRDLTESLEAAE